MVTNELLASQAMEFSLRTDIARSRFAPSIRLTTRKLCLCSTSKIISLLLRKYLLTNSYLRSKPISNIEILFNPKMKIFLSLFMSIFGCLSVYAQTSGDSLVQASVIVDGLIFDETVPTGSLIPGGSSLSFIKDTDGHRVICAFLPEGYELDETVIEKAIPTERVKFGEQLLHEYNELRPETVAGYDGIGVKVGEPMIKFEYFDIDNTVWNNDKLLGKVYVINLWQSECGPCRREMPVLSAWKDQFPDVVFLSASRHTRAEIMPIVEQHHFTWTHLQQATDLVALVRQQGFPLTIVVDKTGIVRFAKVGASADNQAASLRALRAALN
jgi:thiol-disulfide isomerase/thioredoxin